MRELGIMASTDSQVPKVIVIPDLPPGAATDDAVRFQALLELRALSEAPSEGPDGIRL
jgi:hypothetical protein